MYLPSSDRRQYDPRLRTLVHETRNPALVQHLEIPRTTVSHWLRSPPPTPIGVEMLDQEKAALLDENARLRAQLERLRALVRLLVATLRALGATLTETRLPEGQAKERILRAIDRSKGALPLKRALAVLGLTPGRYRAWKRRASTCSLDDLPSCPRSKPTQLTPAEQTSMREMVHADEYLHLSTARLSLVAKRLGRVYASAETWSRYIRERGWNRQRKRLHPRPPKTGVRAPAPNRIWHVDESVLRLVDGVQIYLQAVSDNYSRKILTWSLDATKGHGVRTRDLLFVAARVAGVTTEDDLTPEVYCDRGPENRNGEVLGLQDEGLIRRVFARVDVIWSNSLAEVVWRQMKHQHLYRFRLTSIEQVWKEVASTWPSTTPRPSRFTTVGLPTRSSQGSRSASLPASEPSTSSSDPEGSRSIERSAATSVPPNQTSKPTDPTSACRHGPLAPRRRVVVRPGSSDRPFLIIHQGRASTYASVDPAPDDRSSEK